MVRQLRARTAVHTPFVLYVAELDDAAEREAGLAAGADDCLARRASEREIDARVGAARPIAELESGPRGTPAENRKPSATADLTRGDSPRLFSKQFPRRVGPAARH